MTNTFRDLAINFGLAEREKVFQAARTVLIERFIGPQENWSRDVRDAIGPLPVHNDFACRRIPDICWEFCDRSGVKPANNPDAVRKALLMPFLARSSDGPAYHTTGGTLTDILLDSQRATLQKSYLNAPTTFQRWVSIGEPAANYHQLHRIIADFSSDVGEVPENHEYSSAPIQGRKESYAVRKHGLVFACSIEALVNDDVAALKRPAQEAGDAMARQINRDVYTLLVNNPIMSDGIALFHATEHGENLDATALAAGAPIDVGYARMGTQKSLDGSVVVGVSPKFLIVPQALAGTAMGIAAALYNGSAPLQVVADGVLDDVGSATNWWLASDPNEREQIELTYLMGEESPWIEQVGGFTHDTLNYKIRQSYGVKAIDRRGLYMGNS